MGSQLILLAYTHLGPDIVHSNQFSFFYALENSLLKDPPYKGICDERDDNPTANWYMVELLVNAHILIFIWSIDYHGTHVVLKLEHTRRLRSLLSAH